MKFTQEQLEAGFKLVQPETHWKDRINAVIEAKDEALVYESVIHFTATVPSFSPVKGNKLRVKADGYRMGPCGDH